MRAIGLLALLVAGTAGAADTTADLRFVACPVYRDTDSGAKSGCWLVDDPATGIRYDVSGAPSKPDWNHAVLVEGRASAAAINPCGGKLLDPVRTSIIDEPCTRYMLEAEGFSGRKFALPRRNVRPLYEQRQRPEAPYKPRTVTIPFDFGKSFIVYQLGDYYIDQAINYALDVQPAHVTVTGYAATTPVTISGRTLSEPATLARTRAELVARALVLRGVPTNSITVATATPTANGDEAFDGLREPSLRRVEVRVDPAPGVARP